MLRERIIEIMSRTLNVPAERIGNDAQFDSLENWTSLTHLELMMALEMEFRVTIPTNAMLELLTLADIEEFLRSRMQSKAA